MKQVITPSELLCSLAETNPEAKAAWYIKQINEMSHTGDFDRYNLSIETGAIQAPPNANSIGEQRDTFVSLSVKFKEPESQILYNAVILALRNGGWVVSFDSDSRIIRCMASVNSTDGITTARHDKEATVTHSGMKVSVSENEKRTTRLGTPVAVVEKIEVAGKESSFNRGSGIKTQWK